MNRPKITCVHWSISGTLAERLVTQTDQKARLCRCRLPDDDEGSEATDNSSGGNSLLISIFFQTSDRPPLAAVMLIFSWGYPEADGDWAWDWNCGLGNAKDDAKRIKETKLHQADREEYSRNPHRWIDLWVLLEIQRQSSAL